MKFSLLFLLSLVMLCSCKESKEEPAKPTQIKFDKAKWAVRDSTDYVYRKQMVDDVMNNMNWVGKKKEVVIETLGEPNSREEGNMRYDFNYSEFLGGLGTKIDAVVFELNADSTIKKVRFNGGGWD